MPRLLSLFASLALILSLGMSALAHAGEGTGCIEAPAAELSVHTPGDGDHVAADSDKPYPHHHGGCHNHQIGVLAPGDVTAQPMKLAEDFAPHPAVYLAPAIPDPALRPPRA